MVVLLYCPPYCTRTFSPHTLGGDQRQRVGQFCPQQIRPWRSGAPLPNPFRSTALRLSSLLSPVLVCRSMVLSLWPMKSGGLRRCSSMRLVVFVWYFRSRLLPSNVLSYGVIVYYTLQRRIVPRPSGRMEAYQGNRSRRFERWLRSGPDGRSYSFIAFAPNVSFRGLLGGYSKLVQ